MPLRTTEAVLGFDCCGKDTRPPVSFDILAKFPIAIWSPDTDYETLLAVRTKRPIDEKETVTQSEEFLRVLREELRETARAIETMFPSESERTTVLVSGFASLDRFTCEKLLSDLNSMNPRLIRECGVAGPSQREICYYRPDDAVVSVAFHWYDQHHVDACEKPQTDANPILARLRGWAIAWYFDQQICHGDNDICRTIIAPELEGDGSSFTDTVAVVTAQRATITE